MYLDDIAQAIWRETGETTPAVGRDLALFRIYAVLALAKGRRTTLADVHHAWAAWRAEDMPDHRSLIPFEDLARGVQALDTPYAVAIRTVATRL